MLHKIEVAHCGLVRLPGDQISQFALRQAGEKLLLGIFVRLSLLLDLAGIIGHFSRAAAGHFVNEDAGLKGIEIGGHEVGNGVVTGLDSLADCATNSYRGKGVIRDRTKNEQPRDADSYQGKQFRFQTGVVQVDPASRCRNQVSLVATL